MNFKWVKFLWEHSRVYRYSQIPENVCTPKAVDSSTVFGAPLAIGMQ
jgi:hypothetical protein